MNGNDKLDDPDGRQRRLMTLLGPLHDQARLTARRLCQSNADGDDLFQEAALRALLRLSDLRDEGRFRPWFYAVLLSVHRQRSRRSFWRRFLPFPEPGNPESAIVPERSTAPGADWEDRRSEAARLTQALACLSAEQREAIVLFELDGYSIEEVAELQSGSIAAVKSRLSRGRAQLRRHYQALEPDAVERQEDGLPQKQTPKEELGHG